MQHQRHQAGKICLRRVDTNQRMLLARQNEAYNNIQIVEMQTLVACSVWRSPPHLLCKVERGGWQRSDLTLNPPEKKKEF